MQIPDEKYIGELRTALAVVVRESKNKSVSANDYISGYFHALVHSQGEMMAETDSKILGEAKMDLFDAINREKMTPEERAEMTATADKKTEKSMARLSEGYSRSGFKKFFGIK